MRIGFDLEAIKFEKQMHEKACDLVRSLQHKHSELIQNLHQKIENIKVQARGPVLQ